MIDIFFLEEHGYKKHTDNKNAVTFNISMDINVLFSNDFSQ